MAAALLLLFEEFITFKLQLLIFCCNIDGVVAAEYDTGDAVPSLVALESLTAVTRPAINCCCCCNSAVVVVDGWDSNAAAAAICSFSIFAFSLSKIV